jgi:hypothetical protein
MISQPSPLRSTQLSEALSLLTPYDTRSMNKVRIGAEHDGGYVMFDDFDNISDVYSFGIGNEISFDHHLARIGKKVHMFDHTITDLPFTHPNFVFVQNGLSGENDAANHLFTLPYQIESLGHLDNNKLALKMDIEGAEFDAIPSVPSSTLRQFRQFVLELHGLSRLSEPAYRRMFIDVLVRINSAFTLCHVHANNFGTLAYVDGYLVAETLELTYVRSDLVLAEPSTTIFPTSLDYPNAYWAPDIPLSFFPFLPANPGSVTQHL